jgi:hypothetical protein
MNLVPRRVVACVITGLILALGLWLFLANVRTDAQIQQESAQRSAEPYTPMCDGKQMRPGDVCMRFGGNAKSQTYREMVDEHDKEGSPQALSSNHAYWRVAGLVVTAVGALALALSFFALVLVFRARRGRRALAEARGWTFQESDPNLVARLNSAEIRSPRPEASCVIMGDHNGYPFLMFDFRDASMSNGKNTMFVLIMPQQLPYLVIDAAGTVNARSSGTGRQLYTQVEGLVRSRKLGWAAITGKGLLHRWGGFFSPRQSAIIERLDALTQLASTLHATARTMPAPGTPPTQPAPAGPPAPAG